MARILSMNIFKRIWNWFRRTRRNRALTKLVQEAERQGFYSPPAKKPKRQRYSGIKTRIYEDKPVNYHHVSRPLAWSPELNRYVFATAKGITYRRAK